MIIYATTEVLDPGSGEVVTLTADGKILETVHVDDPRRRSEVLRRAGYEHVVWQPALF